MPLHPVQYRPLPRVPIRRILGAASLSFLLGARILPGQPPPEEQPSTEQTPTEQTPTEQTPTGEEVAAQPEDGETEDGEARIAAPLPAPIGILPVSEFAEPTVAFRDPVVQALVNTDGLVLRTRSGRVSAYADQGATSLWGIGNEVATRFLGWEGEDRTRLFLLDETGRLSSRSFLDGVETGERHLASASSFHAVGRTPELLLTAGPGTLAGYRITTGEPVFQVSLPGERIGTLVVAPREEEAEGSLVAVTMGQEGILLGVAGSAGFREIWRESGVGEIGASVLFVPEREVLFVGSLEGRLSALHLSDGKIAWSWLLSEAFRHPPHAGERFLFAATEANTLYAFELRGGSERWRAALPGRPAGPPLGIGDRVLVTTRDGLVLEFDPRTGLAGGGGQDMEAEIVGIARGAGEESGEESGEAPGMGDWKRRRLYLGLRDGRLAVLGPSAAAGEEAASEESDREPTEKTGNPPEPR